MLIAAEEHGTRGAEAYGLGNEYGLLDPEAASHAAEALNEGLVAAMRPAAEATRDQRSELLGIQAEVHPSRHALLGSHARIGPYPEVLVLYLLMRCSRACAFRRSGRQRLSFLHLRCWKGQCRLPGFRSHNASLLAPAARTG